MYQSLLLNPNTASVNRLGNEIEVRITGSEEGCSDLLEDLIRDGYRIVEFKQQGGDLESVFMNVTKGEVQ